LFCGIFKSFNPFGLVLSEVDVKFRGRLAY